MSLSKTPVVQHVVTAKPYYLKIIRLSWRIKAKLRDGRNKMNVKEIDVLAPWGKISVKLWGSEDDPAVLTVHGVMDNAGSFDGIIPLLPQHYFYICIDLPGHGRSSHFPPHLPIHSINYILVYTLVIEYFKRDKYIIMGHSYGGQLGFLYAQLYPSKVEKLIMFDTVHLFPVPSNYFIHQLKDYWDNHFSMEEKKKMKSAPQYTYEEALDKIMMGRSAPVPEKAAKALLERMLIPKGNGKYEFSLDQRLKYFINPMHDQRYMIETIKENPVKCPILIVFGIDSTPRRKVIKSVLTTLKKQNNVTVIYVPGDHDVHQTDSDLVAPHVEKFLNLQNSKL